LPLAWRSADRLFTQFVLCSFTADPPSYIGCLYRRLL